VRGVLEALEDAWRQARRSQADRLGGYRRVIVMVVNSLLAPKTDWDRNETPPGFVVQAAAASGCAIDRYSFEPLTMKDPGEIQKWRAASCWSRRRGWRG